MTAHAAPIPELAALGNLAELHERVANGIAYLRAHNDQPLQFSAGSIRLNGIADEYLRALCLFREATPLAELEAQIAEVETRLDTGWGKHSSPAADERWVQLLTVHEIFVDAALVDTYLVRLDERIALCRIPAIVRTGA